MNKFKLNTIAFLLSGGMVSVAMADMHTNHDAAGQGVAEQQAGTMEAAPNDAVLINDVKAAVTDYADKVNASVRNGVVYLAGELPSDTDYEKLITMAESVKGVKDVNVDALTVKESKNPLYDTYLTAKVKGLLIQKDVMGKDIPSWTLVVETKNGEVYLSGTVANAEEKQKVLDIAKSVQGVTNVHDKMQVATATKTLQQENMMGGQNQQMNQEQATEKNQQMDQNQTMNQDNTDATAGDDNQDATY